MAKDSIHKLHKASMRYYRQLNVNQRINLKGNYENAVGRGYWDEVKCMSLTGVSELYVVCCRMPKQFRELN